MMHRDITDAVFGNIPISSRLFFGCFWVLRPTTPQTPATEAVAGEGPCGAVSQSWTKRIAEVVA